MQTSRFLFGPFHGARRNIGKKSAFILWRQPFLSQSNLQDITRHLSKLGTMFCFFWIALKRKQVFNTEQILIIQQTMILRLFFMKGLEQFHWIAKLTQKIGEVPLNNKITSHCNKYGYSFIHMFKFKEQKFMNSLDKFDFR